MSADNLPVESVPRPSLAYQHISRPFLNSISTTVVDIRVGKDAVLFRLHKDLICSRVPYFDKMFNGGFKEASEQSADLDEDDPDSFDVFVDWIYYNKIRPLYMVITEDGERTMSWDVVELFALAEKLCLPALMDGVRMHYENTRRKNRSYPLPVS